MMKTPSFSTGFRLSLRLPSMILALWIMPIILFAPLRALVSASAGRVLRTIPEGFSPPPGDIGLLTSHSLMPLVPALSIVIAGSLILMWAWTILWHAGICRWLIWDGGTPGSLPKILGHGVMGWMSYLRLSLWAWLMFLVVFGGVGAGGFLMIRRAWDAMNEDRMVLLILVSIILLGLLKIILWAATLRGAWELAIPGKRSAVRAWFRGLRGALSQPVATLLPTAIFGILIAGSLAMPLLLHIGVPSFRTGWKIWVVLAISELFASYLLLWIFTSMASITGVLPTAAEIMENTTLDTPESNMNIGTAEPQAEV